LGKFLVLISLLECPKANLMQRGGESTTSENVLVPIDFDIKFTYVLWIGRINP
jgi:hypothetical protein